MSPSTDISEMKEDIRTLMNEIRELRKENSEIKESVAFMRGQMEGSGYRIGAPIGTTTSEQNAVVSSMTTKQNLVMMSVAGLISAVTAVITGHFGGVSK